MGAPVSVRLVYVTEVRLGSTSEHLLLRPDESELIVQRVTAELVCNGLRAELQVVHSYISGFADLAAFFGWLEQDWRGWDGARSWSSAEGDLKLEARHHHQHVRLCVTLTQPAPGWDDNGWVCSADLTLDPGEQLSQVTRDLHELARPFDHADEDGKG